MSAQRPPRPAIIVDDERLARRDLRDLLEAQHAAAVRVAGEAATVAEAATLARTSGADVVFLDIHLAAESGFDLLPLLEPDVDVVFVAGRLVERERARRADCRARWRATFEEVDRLAGELG